jgi:multiple sugar transport system substrate-binding protein
MQPGWYITFIGYWFGAPIYDAASDRIILTDPRMVRAFEWIRGYAERLGKDSLSEFRSGFGNWTSTQNPFIARTIAMEMQGPWMYNVFEKYRPAMNHAGGRRSPEHLSVAQRRDACEWGVAPFPSADARLVDVTYANSDVLTVPRGARHKREAFEFIAYVNRQEVTEKLNILNCQNSPLRQVSRRFLKVHPNPYIEVFERLLASPNARGVPPCPIWPEVGAELDNAVQRLALLQSTAEQALRDAQRRVDEKYEEFKERQRARGKGAA